jgi:hypothetical protein
MKLLWSLIAWFYTYLINTGYNIALPKWLFNKPKTENLISIIKEIHADDSFTDDERVLILQAARDLEFFCNDWFTFDIKFDLNIEDEDSFLHENIMIRADGENENIVDSDKAHKNFTVGLCLYWDDGSRDLYLVHDRIRTSTQWRLITIHELGHFINLGHTKPKSIMYKTVNAKVLYPTRIDAEEFAKVYGCDVSDLRYFKL